MFFPWRNNIIEATVNYACNDIGNPVKEWLVSWNSSQYGSLLLKELGLLTSEANAIPESRYQRMPQSTLLGLSSRRHIHIL
jgi:hypothetical protein